MGGRSNKEVLMRWSNLLINVISYQDHWPVNCHITLSGRGYATVPATRKFCNKHVACVSSAVALFGNILMNFYSWILKFLLLSISKFRLLGFQKHGFEFSSKWWFALFLVLDHSVAVWVGRVDWRGSTCMESSHLFLPYLFLTNTFFFN